MSESSGMKTTEFVLSDKIQYEQFMLGNRQECRAGDRFYRYVRGEIVDVTESNYKIENKHEEIRTPLLAA